MYEKQIHGCHASSILSDSSVIYSEGTTNDKSYIVVLLPATLTGAYWCLMPTVTRASIPLAGLGAGKSHKLVFPSGVNHESCVSQEHLIHIIPILFAWSEIKMHGTIKQQDETGADRGAGACWGGPKIAPF